MEYGVNILIKAIDAATGPINRVRKRLDTFFAPLDKLQKRLKRLGNVSGITKLAKSIKGLHEPLKKSWEEAGKLVAKLGLLGGGLLGGAIAGFKALFLNVATQNEALARSMANVTGSAAGAKAALAAVQASLRGWDTEDAANAYMALKKAGLGTSEADLKKLGDIAGHTGKSLSDVAEAMAALKDGSTGGLEELLGGNIKKFGDYVVAEFTDAEGKLRRMAVKQTGNAAKDARALQQLMNKAVSVKGMEGGAERFGQSWQGMVQRALAMWHRFRTLVMDSGPFALLKKKFAGILATFDELEKNGGLQALAEEWAQKFTDAIESLWTSGKALVAWFKAEFLPAFESVKEFLGGWSGVFKAVAAIIAGPFILSLVNTVTAIASVATALAGPLVKAFALAKIGVVALGKAMLTTPLGWIMAAIAAVAAVVYLIYKSWSKITGWLKQIWAPVPEFFRGVWQKISGVFTGAWNAITGFVTGKIDKVLAAFDKGFLQGMLAIFTEFNPSLWIAEALDDLGEKLFGFSLIDAGKKIVGSLLDGLKSAWKSVVDWLDTAWDGLTGWLPDSVRGKLGINADKPKPSVAAAPSGPSTGAAAIMAGGAAAAPGRLPDQKLTTEVVITGENLPPGISVSAPKSQADKTRLNCGYMMAGAH